MFNITLTALLLGILIVVFIIYRFKRTGLERTRWAYPTLLVTFPLYYFSFALYANDLHALGYEVLVGLTFFLIAYIALQSCMRTSLLLVGLGCLMHGVYDVYHDHFFINAGTPDWWIAFCCSIDVILGGYLIYRVIRPVNTVKG
jgi:hypothetical protein